MKNKKSCTYHTVSDINNFDDIYTSIYKCAKNVKWKKTTIHFLLNQPEETFKLEKDLKENKYKERNSKVFIVHEPKEREVISINFRDRVFQKNLIDNILTPIMTRDLIYDNCVSQKDKGTDFARERLKKHLRNFYNEYGSNEGYIIHIDIKKYYPYMPHETAINCFKRKLYKNLDVLEVVKSLLKTYEVRGQDCGYYAGSQLIQLVGICVLNDVDHFIKEQLRIKYYVRYMDDLILIVRDNPEYYLNSIEKELNLLGFNLNKEKTLITKIHKGDIFLGFKFSLSKTGKVYMCISTKNLKRARRKCRVRSRESFDTWYAHAIKSTSKKHIKEIKDYYETIHQNELN